MKALIRLIGCLVIALVAIGGPASAKASKELPPSFALKGLEGGTVKSKDLRGRMVVMQFFASWCEGCGEVMSQLNPLVAGADGARFLTVSVDETMGEARDYFKRQKPSVRPLWKLAYFDANAKLASKLDVTALPAVLVFDEDGQVVMSITGHPNKKQLDRLKRLIAK